MTVIELEKLGLTHNEAKVYESLLKAGETKTGTLVKTTGMHRVLVYDALESLIQKGLASYVVKENIKHFQASSPQRIIDFLEEKKEMAATIIPQLTHLQKSSQLKQSVSIYEGVIGLKSALNNMLKELTPKTQHYVFASGNMAKTMGPYYYLYQKIKKEKKIKTKIIYDEAFRSQKKIIAATSGDIRFFHLGIFPTDTWIYNDKTLIVTYTADPPFAILITSKHTADSYARLFESFWKQAKK